MMTRKEVKGLIIQNCRVPCLQNLYRTITLQYTVVQYPVIQYTVVQYTVVQYTTEQ